MDGADVIAEILRREGTEFLSCYPRNPLIEACAKIGIRPAIPLAGGVLAVASFLILVWHSWDHNPGGLIWLAGFYAVAGALEGGLCCAKGARKIRNSA